MLLRLKRCISHHRTLSRFLIMMIAATFLAYFAVDWRGATLSSRIEEKQLKPASAVARHQPPISYNSDIQTRLVFNRVPKCGSITFTRLFYELGARNNFNVTSPYEPGETPWLSDEQQQKTIAAVNAQPSPSVYIRHQYFIDFNEHNTQSPLYINVIRDPIARFTSFYHFIRFGNKEGDGADVPMDDKKKSRSLEDCIIENVHECKNPVWQIVPYLCGQAPMCRERTEAAVELAKQNLLKKYFAVGILEDLGSFLEFLERALPDYFAGARAILGSKIANDTYTLNKHGLSDGTYELFRNNPSIKLEYDLYYFVRDTLHGKMKSLGME